MLAVSGHVHTYMWQTVCYSKASSSLNETRWIPPVSHWDTAPQRCSVPVCVFRCWVLTFPLSPSQMHAVLVFLFSFAFCVLISQARFLLKLLVSTSSFFSPLVCVWEVLKYFTDLWRCAFFRLWWALVHIPGVKKKKKRALVGLASLLTHNIIRLCLWSTMCFVGFPCACTSNTRLDGLLIFSGAIHVLSFPSIALTWVTVVASFFFPQLPNLLFQVHLFLHLEKEKMLLDYVYRKNSVR